ncbi:MAG: carbohydrate kinase family protein [Catenulispora sp.]
MVGETLIDLIPVDDDLYRAVPGGSPANVAVGLARLGVPTRMAARISADPPGRILRRRLAEAGVDLRGVVAAAEPSSLALVTHETDGPRYDLRLHDTADWQWTEAELARIGPESLAALHVGSLAAVLPPGAHEIAAAVRRVRRTATVSYDPNVRPERMAAVPDARRRISALIELADVVKLSDADLAWLAPGADPVGFARSVVAAGAGLAVVTLGSAGAVGACAAGVVEVPACEVEVVDTVGAGDAHMSTLLSGLYDRGLLGAAVRAGLRAVDGETLAAVLRDAALAAAVVCGRRGSDPPTRAELQALAVAG